MSSLNNRQSGFSPLILIVIIVAIGLVAYLGYTFYTTSQQQADSTTEQSAVAEDVETAPPVDSSSDLDTTLSTLEETDTTSSSDSAELDSQLSTF